VESAGRPEPGKRERRSRGGRCLDCGVLNFSGALKTAGFGFGLRPLFDSLPRYRGFEMEGFLVWFSKLKPL
jgi:hypothetical protein